MKRLFLIGLTFIIGLSSCSKDENAIILSGKFNETHPINGRSQLEFISDNILIKSETGSVSRDTFKYEISSEKIKLTPIWTDDSQTSEFDFCIIDNSRFKIQNLYPGIPEVPQSFMTFEK